MLDQHQPDLTFPMVVYGGKATPWDLRVLLYKGGAEVSSKVVFTQIAKGELGRPVVERLEPVKRMHEAISARLVGGGSKETARTTVQNLRRFFAWADAGGHTLSLETVEATFRLWSDFLLQQVRLRELKETSAFTQALSVSRILDDALERPQPLIVTTRVRKPKRGERAVGVAADKQNLAETFAFGHLCLDVIDSLPVEAVFGPLPVAIRLRDGRVLEHWSKLPHPAKLALRQPAYKQKGLSAAKNLRARAAWEADRTLRTRFPVANFRVLAELMVFIAQTGMNLSQAHQLRRTQFSYKSSIDGYEVRDYKHRRRGEVLFEIFAEYRTHFERYLAWRNQVFAGEHTDLLFPFVRLSAVDSTPPSYVGFRNSICKPAGIPFLTPQRLRKTRINWLLRQSRNPAQTAEQAQHTKQTLLRVYEEPSLQVAQAEIIAFWRKNDPRLGGNPMPSIAPGVCDGTPKPIPELPPEAPKPDCTHPAGCLFCEHHRDIDSEDYVWSTSSMRHLNTLVLRGFRPVKKGTDAARQVQLAIEVLTAKLRWFRDSNAKRKGWVEEAVERIGEDDFHPHWRYLIESAEGI